MLGYVGMMTYQFTQIIPQKQAVFSFMLSHLRPVVPEPASSQDMLAYSGSTMLCIKTGSFPPHMQKLQGACRGEAAGGGSLEVADVAWLVL